MSLETLLRLKAQQNRIERTGLDILKEIKDMALDLSKLTAAVADLKIITIMPLPPDKPHKLFRVFRVGPNRMVLFDIVVVAPADATIAEVQEHAFALGCPALHRDTQVEELA